MQIFPFRLSFDGLTITGAAVESLDLVAVSFTISDLLNGVVVKGSFAVVTDTVLGTTYEGEVTITFGGLEEDIYFEVTELELLEFLHTLFDEEDLDDPPLNTFGLGDPYIGGRSSWLDSVDLDGYGGSEPRVVPTLEEVSNIEGLWRDLALRLTGTALVHVPGFGTSWPPVSTLSVDQIVREALQL